MPALAGNLYRIMVSTPGTPPGGTPETQAHYRLKVKGGEWMGTYSPSSPSFEPAPAKWYFNVGEDEDLNLSVLVTDTPASSTTLTYTLPDPNGVPTTGSAATTSADEFVNVPGIPGTWELDVHSALDHYRLEKTTSTDRGIYLLASACKKSDKSDKSDKPRSPRHFVQLPASVRPCQTALPDGRPRRAHHEVQVGGTPSPSPDSSPG